MVGQRTWLRLSLFALVVLASFGIAYAIGERLPGHDHDSPTEIPSHEPGHTGASGLLNDQVTLIHD